MGRDYTADHIHTMSADIRNNIPPGMAGALLDILDKAKSGVPMTADQLSAIIRIGEQQAAIDKPGAPGSSNANIVNGVSDLANFQLGLQTMRAMLEGGARAPETISAFTSPGTHHMLTTLATDYSDPVNWDWESEYDMAAYEDIDSEGYWEEFGWGDDLFGFDGYGYQMNPVDLLDEHITPNEFFGLQGNEDDITAMLNDFGDSLGADLRGLEMIKGPAVVAREQQMDNSGFDFAAQPSGVSGPAMKLPGQA